MTEIRKNVLRTYRKRGYRSVGDRETKGAKVKKITFFAVLENGSIHQLIAIRIANLLCLKGTQE